MSELDIRYRHYNTNDSLDRKQLGQTLVNSLRQNASLRTLKFQLVYRELQFLPVNLGWPSVSNLLCDTSSIAATIQSNHTLESIFIDDAPMAIYSMLYMNRNKNKQAVIRQKILRNHDLYQVNFVPASLPVVFSWLGDANVCHTLGLSQMFQILRAVPHILGHKVIALVE